MESFFYSVNATAPVFLVILLGYTLRRIGILDEHFVSVCNRFNFKITLPVMLFVQMTETSLRDNFSGGFVLLCAVITVLSAVGIWIGARIFLKDRHMVGAFVQAGYRSSVAVLDMALVTNIYGSGAVVPMMMVGSVPLFNVFAVLILTLEGPTHEESSLKENLLKAGKDIVTNPILLAILLGMAASWFEIRFPLMLERGMGDVADMAMPQALVCIGASFQGTEALKKIKPTLAVTFIKLMVLPGVFLPICVALGLRGEYLAAVLVMQGSPTTSTGYVMAENMGGDGVLASSAVVSTTVLSAFSLTFWVFLSRYFGLI